MTTKIIFEDMKIHAFHGVLEEERKIGTYYLINAELEVDLWKASETDDLADTVNYADINSLFHEEMATPSLLLERVVGRMISRIEKEFPQVKSIQIQLNKTNPPMKGEMKGVGVVFRKEFLRS